MRSRQITRAEALRRNLAAAALSLLVAACGDSRSPEAESLPPSFDSREAALALFQAAQTNRTSPKEIEALVPPDLTPERRMALAETLAGLRKTLEARLVGEEPVGVDRSAVDIEILLPGGGTARYSVQVERKEDRSWRVISIHGPGAAWPPNPTPGDEGLSTSPPP